MFCWTERSMKPPAILFNVCLKCCGLSGGRYLSKYVFTERPVSHKGGAGSLSFHPKQIGCKIPHHHCEQWRWLEYSDTQSEHKLSYLFIYLLMEFFR